MHKHIELESHILWTLFGYFMRHFLVLAWTLASDSDNFALIFL